VTCCGGGTEQIIKKKDARMKTVLCRTFDKVWLTLFTTKPKTV